MNLFEFNLDHESLLPLVSLKRSIEENNKYNDEDTFENRMVKYGNMAVELGKIIDSLFKKIKQANIKLSLQNVFEMTDETIDDLYYLSDLKISSKNGKKPAVAIFLMDLLKRCDHKYLGSPCFIVNMSCIADFNEALSIFNMGRISVNEQLMNITGRSSSNTFISPIGITDEKFKVENIDICLYLTKKIIYICSLFTSVSLSLTEIKSLYSNLDSKNMDNLFNINISLNRLSKKLSGKLSEKSCTHDIQKYLSMIESKNVTYSYKRVLDICSFKWSIVEKFINEFKNDIFNNPHFLMIKHCCTLCSIIKEYSDEFIDTIIYLMRKNEYLLGEFSSVLTKYIEISMKKHGCKIDEYLTRDRLIKIYESCKYVHIDINFLSFYLSFPYDDDIIELLYLLFLIKGSKINGGVAVDSLSLLLSIKTDNITLDKRDDRSYYDGPNIGRYYIGKKDNFLFCRIARLFLFRDMFTRLREFDLLSENCGTSILSHLPYNKIKMSRIREFYNQTIDVHNGQRDENTRKIYERFLGLNSYGEFINNDPDSMGEIIIATIEDTETNEFIKPDESIDPNPWQILDNVRSNEKKKKENQLDEYQGVLSKLQIDILFNEFWIECKNKITSISDIEGFFRVMGVNFEMEPIEKKSKDFGGFFIDGTYVRGTKIDQKLILAHLWNFCKKNNQERLCDVMINCYKKMIQSKTYIVEDKMITTDYCVCNDGKLQYFACSILQGRIKDESDEVMMIDKENKVIIDESKSIIEMNTSQMYTLLKPFYDGISEEGNIPKDCNEMFRIFFCYIRDNNLDNYIKLAIETLCLYSEGTSGFIVNPDLALPSLFSGYFDIDDYTLIKNHIEIRIDVHHDDHLIEDFENYEADSDDELDEGYF